MFISVNDKIVKTFTPRKLENGSNFKEQTNKNKFLGCTSLFFQSSMITAVPYQKRKNLTCDIECHFKKKKHKEKGSPTALTLSHLAWLQISKPCRTPVCFLPYLKVNSLSINTTPLTCLSLGLVTRNQPIRMSLQLLFNQ